MDEIQNPLKALVVSNALARRHGPVGFAELKETTQLAQATLNRVLNNLCRYGYAIKMGHGQYLAGPKLVDMGQEIVRNQLVRGFEVPLSELKQRTKLNAELYVITPNGPVFLTHSPARDGGNIPFRFGHLIRNRDAHPAALFYLGIHKGDKAEGYRENFIVDRGGQWPELFRAAAMIPSSNFCLALSGKLINVDEDRIPELKEQLQQACREMEFPKGESGQAQGKE